MRMLGTIRARASVLAGRGPLRLLRALATSSISAFQNPENDQGGNDGGGGGGSTGGGDDDTGSLSDGQASAPQTPDTAPSEATTEEARWPRRRATAPRCR